MQHLDITEGRRELAKHALEKDVQAAVIHYLTVHKIPHSVTDATETYNARGQMVSRVTTSGWPDVTACLPNGKFLGCEMKRAVGGVLSYEQGVCLDAIYKAGGLVVVARSVDDLIEAMMSGVRDKDLAEIAAAIAKGPNVKAKVRGRMNRGARRLRMVGILRKVA